MSTLLHPLFSSAIRAAKGSLYTLTYFPGVHRAASWSSQYFQTYYSFTPAASLKFARGVTAIHSHTQRWGALPREESLLFNFQWVELFFKCQEGERNSVGDFRAISKGKRGNKTWELGSQQDVLSHKVAAGQPSVLPASHLLPPISFRCPTRAHVSVE